MVRLPVSPIKTLAGKELCHKNPMQAPMKQEEKTRKPNELNGVYFSSHVKIFDPNTKEVFVQKRADD